MTVTVTDIMDAINRRLIEKWPDRTVYVDVCPADFVRPSFWLRVEQDKVTDANRQCIMHDAALILVLHDQLDDHYDASWYRLSGEAAQVMDLLGRVLSVGQRKIRLLLTTLPRQADTISIRAQCQWMDMRPGADEGQNVPAATDYTVRVEAQD